MNTAQNLQALQEKIGHQFSTRTLLADALTHSSTGGKKNYERLEFLGDRVLGLVVSDILYHKFPGEAEGDLARRLSALVQGSFLAQIAQDLDLGAHVMLSDAERQAGGAQNDNILADVMESLIGALYLDAGLDACRAFIEARWGSHFETMARPPQHPKTALQEWAQSQGLPLPLYEILGQSGPDHAPVFELQLTVQGCDPVRVEGKSRQMAEKEAASQMMVHIKQKSKGKRA